LSKFCEKTTINGRILSNIVKQFGEFHKIIGEFAKKFTEFREKITEFAVEIGEFGENKTDVA